MSRTLSIFFLSWLPREFPQRQSNLPVLDNAFVQKQFGSTCTLLPGFNAAVADFDGDGVDDIMDSGTLQKSHAGPG